MNDAKPEITLKIGDVIAEKKKNFTLFLIKTLIDNNKIPDICKIEINKFIDIIQKTNIDQFIYFIQSELIKYKNKTNIYVDNLFIQYGINTEDVTNDDIDKFKRYIELFIKLVQ